MSDKYTYLETNTAYSSGELSLRLEDVAGANRGLNAIDLSSLSLGCFRSNLIPRMIHSSSLTGILPKNRFTSELDVGFRNLDTLQPTAAESDHLIESIVYPESSRYELDMEVGKQNIGAVLVLANVCVERIFCEWAGEEPSAGENASKYAPNEDVVFVNFKLTIVDDAGESHDIDRSSRSLSPRVTISKKEEPRYTGLNTKNPDSGSIHRNHRGDVQTFQDVSIRCVILPSDLPADRKIAEIEFRFNQPDNYYGEGGGPPRIAIQKLYYSKANLTAIPIHTKVS